MSFKNILVHIDDNDKESAVRLEVAIELALKHNANLTGLYAIPKVYVPGYVDAYIPVDFQVAQEQSALENAKNAEAKFESIVDKTACVSEWCCVDGYTAQQINQHARYADLIIIGQSEDHGVMSDEMAIEGHVLLGSARPILFIPYIGVITPIGKQIMVAWNGTREAVRAINDAMPLLKRADMVDVVAVNSSAREGKYSMTDICQYLALHDVKAEARLSVSTNISVADTLLSMAADRNTDLIVMGAYSHSRMRELIFGGVTDHMLKHMTIPVLMSH